MGLYIVRTIIACVHRPKHKPMLVYDLKLANYEAHEGAHMASPMKENKRQNKSLSFDRCQLIYSLHFSVISSKFYPPFSLAYFNNTQAVLCLSRIYLTIFEYTKSNDPLLSTECHEISLMIHFQEPFSADSTKNTLNFAHEARASLHEGHCT